MDDTPQSRTISGPSELLQAAIEKNHRNDEICLRLFMPLLSTSMLASCRQHSKTRLGAPKPDGQLGRETQEILDLEPLFKSWRFACSNFPIDSEHPLRFVFDINLPSGEDDALRISWGRSEGSGLCIIEEQVLRFVQGIATVMHMKSKGTVSVAVSGVEEYRRLMPETRRKYFGGLEDVLEKLSG